MALENDPFSVEKRIRQTLLLAEERGYNLSIEQLSKKLLGGQIPLPELTSFLKTGCDFDSDGVFLATKGNLHSEKCRTRQTSNRVLQPMYTQIATRYISKYIRLCPWVSCILISGSMASDGLGQGDDIDLDLIVPDGLKYTSYFLGLMLSFLYSFRYGKQFWRRYVICISVIWEHHQVLPFQRNDGQLAFELLNAKVYYNKSFFSYVLSTNPWLQAYFPQMYNQGEIMNQHYTALPQLKKRLLTRGVEYLAKNLLFLIVKIAMRTVFHDHDVRHHMMVKHPYALFDVPDT